MMHRFGVWLVAAAMVGTIAPAVRAVQPCAQNCAVLTVGNANAAPGGVAVVNVDFQPGPDDGQPEKGIDDVAALAFTMGIPGTGGDKPLSLSSCGDSNLDGLVDAVAVGAPIANDFRVVIENADAGGGGCISRDRCLCPAGGQNLDNFVNVAVYGPKALPDHGPVDIPTLPGGRLMSIALRVAPGLPVGTEIPVHVFVKSDASVPPLPGEAPLSVGDQSAVDVTCVGSCVDGATPDTMRVRVVDGIVRVVAALACPGDCDENDRVSVDELVLGVNMALGNAAVESCQRFDANTDTVVTIDELVLAVGKAIHGCS